MIFKNRVDCVQKLALICFIMLQIMDVECVDKNYKPRKKSSKGKRRGRMNSEDLDFSGGFWIIGVLFALITLPIIGYFVYSVIKDPVTPSVLKNAVDVWKEKYFGYISQNKSSTDLDDTHSTEHERVRNNIIETPRSLNMRRNMHNRSKYVNIEEEEYQEGNS